MLTLESTGIVGRAGRLETGPCDPGIARGDSYWSQDDGMAKEPTGFVVSGGGFATMTVRAAVRVFIAASCTVTTMVW